MRVEALEGWSGRRGPLYCICVCSYMSIDDCYCILIEQAKKSSLVPRFSPLRRAWEQGHLFYKHREIY